MLGVALFPARPGTMFETIHRKDRPNPFSAPFRSKRWHSAFKSLLTSSAQPHPTRLMRQHHLSPFTLSTSGNQHTHSLDKVASLGRQACLPPAHRSVIS